MACTISDLYGYRDNTGVNVGLVSLPIVAVPSSSTLIFAYAGTWKPNNVNNPLILGNESLSHGVETVTGALGAWSIVLPYAATETQPSSPLAKWSLLFPDGSILTGVVPSVAGPLTVYDLVNTHGWAWSSQVYVAPVTAGASAKGTASFTGASDTVSIVFATYFVSATYQIYLGASVDSVTGAPLSASYNNKTTSGFDIVVANATDQGLVDWKAEL